MPPRLESEEPVVAVAPSVATPSSSTISNDDPSGDAKTTEDHKDHRMEHVWMWEERPADIAGSVGVLTKGGLTHIANHKYKGGAYTALDTLLNPFWEACTQLLPLWLAPNLVTTIGGAFCLGAYCVTAWYDPTMTGRVPDWMLVVNGLCQVAYYTLDCMDGKQARRTKSSSPLGQLFDHGVDSLGNISHLSICQCVVRYSTRQYLWMHITLQLLFFQAQWEEYYTGVLPHASGNFGVTEMLYGIAMWTIVTGLVFKSELYATQLPSALQDVNLPLRSTVLAEREEPLQVRDLLLLVWMYTVIALSVQSLIRIARKLKSVDKIASAYSKLLTPTAACVAAVWLLPDNGSIRYSSLSLGLCLCLITIKQIVFSMAGMAYAMIQFDVVPFLVATVVLSRTETAHAKMVFQFLTLFYLFRLVQWTRSAILQICDKLNIQLFRIKYNAKQN